MPGHLTIEQRVARIEHWLGLPPAHDPLNLYSVSPLQMALARISQQVNRLERTIMTIADDLTAGVAQITANITALGDAITANQGQVILEIQALTAALGGNTVDP